MPKKEEKVTTLTYIKRVTMSGFKSFGNRTVSVSLAKGFTCIIGPNGNGKSNVIDALCFALGRMSKKTMRAKSLTDLIFAGSKTKKPATKAEVEITFDNRDKVFPSDASEYSISRWIRKKGTSGYKIQGKKATRETILNALAQANIDPDGSNQFILQGRIVELTHMNTNKRREFIEELIGLSKYDRMKEQTLKELEKADKDLGQFEAIFKEVSAQLKKVEKEKNDALRWKELDNLVKLHNAQLIALKIHNLRQEEEEVEADIESTQLVIEELEGKIKRQKDRIESESLLLKGIEEDIAGMEEEKSKLDETLTSQKSDLSAKEATLQASKDNLKRLEQNIIKLEELQDKLEEGQTYTDLVTLTNQEIDVKEKEIDETSELIEENTAQQKGKEASIAEINKIKTEINKEISKVHQEIKALSTEIKLLEKSIKKNTKKLEKLESDLAKLKKEGESVEEAIKTTSEEANEISKTINDLKSKIEEQKKRQKEIDKELLKLEKSRDKANQKLADIQAAISSTGAEIKMIEKQIEDLETRKNKMQKEYDRLTKGKKVEDQINELKKSEKEILENLKNAKESLKKANDDQKRSENKKEGLEHKRRTLESELADFEKRLSGLKVELKNAQNELKTAEREKSANDLKMANVQKEIEALTSEKSKFDKQAQNIQNKLTQLQEERKILQEQIDKKETEQEQNSSELQSVLGTLQSLMENIDRSAGNVKSDIQNASQVAIDESESVLRSFVMDITDMLGTINEIAGKQAQEIKEELEQVVTTLNFLIENSDQPIQQLNEVVKEASEEALLESTSNFDGFIADFVNKFDSIRLALQAIAISDTSEVYKALDGLNEGIQRDQNKLAELKNNLTKIETQLEQKNKDQSELKILIGNLTKSIEENSKRVEKGNKENQEKSEQIELNENEIKKLTQDLDGIKKFSENYWKITKELQETIDKHTSELAQVQADLNDLGSVKRILDDIENATQDQVSLSEDIEAKKKTINDLEKSSDTAKADVQAVVENTKTVKGERDIADEKRNELQIQIDEENEKLKEVTARLKDLENVQKLISDIETLNHENEEAQTKIEDNSKQIEVLEGEITTQEEKIVAEDAEIEKIQAERKELEEKEKILRNTIKQLSNEKNNLEKTRDKQKQMQNRAEEIDDLKNEMGELGDAIADLEEKIKEIIENIGKLELERSEKLDQLSELQSQKSDSWQKQKGMQEELSDLNSDLSRNSAKFNNLETRKIVLEERIDELFEKSKDYGTLPPVTDDLAEASLNQAIAKATNEKTALEPVNLKSIEEYEVVRERWDEIDMRRQTLQRERKAILDSIDRIELEKTRNFMKAYHEINRVFSNVFQQLSPGGSAKMILENPAHPFEAGINIEARPRGKKISSLTILSGGEKTLVALSFIFAVQNFYPAPFYIMDEIDAALDGPNVYRVSMVIKEYAAQAQFLVISHREENITNSDRIYGVAMNDGITDIFTVDLEEEKDRDDFGAAIEGTDEEDLDKPIVVDNDEDDD
ncbi:Chromosome partition protein Smc [Candidatus Lokiarchaeum ossiferum]|uniref:Chromosome partition protein Smc n=1 Tax=Candidatus Lokiarchaeum ossiferum TaxID=2951803 RepID=A0ABY6HSX0_9ARCH|nr:Chromosome partition protein Smc [Candidatus Lokiarchaeum sp. B-35]